VDRCVADLPGGFTRKLVNGRAYWYYQAKSPNGAPIQTYVGPDDAATVNASGRTPFEPVR